MALDVLQWTNKSREDVNFVLEGKLQFTQATEANWRRWNVKMTPVSALLVTLGRNSLEPPSSLQDDGTLNFPVETGVVEAALLLIREKNNRFSMIKVNTYIMKKNLNAVRPQIVCTDFCPRNFAALNKVLLYKLKIVKKLH